ncbi:hypothetical protein XCV3983 [Xanthomonas euvesicatoria pv. vesicatoria str. 85-10]|uniref:Uncharacterized protein n=1 Tax=Xanthomonas euvesicatoria pv. vesicatoria (strain 85-10) TaxID=316273 RepID=Q3BNE9_XANE5|nr:hypothetical protein XCV3983 [Xanthomonas euvesicatoria pv. vesicatoria str. 85-10]
MSSPSRRHARTNACLLHVPVHRAVSRAPGDDLRFRGMLAQRSRTPNRAHPTLRFYLHGSLR